MPRVRREMLATQEDRGTWVLRDHLERKVSEELEDPTDPTELMAELETLVTLALMVLRLGEL